ncbi:MAG: hypothetical protein RL022_3102, partial [Chloroflexota bacterium]
MTTRDSDEQIASNLKHGSVATL